MISCRVQAPESWLVLAILMAIRLSVQQIVRVIPGLFREQETSEQRHEPFQTATMNRLQCYVCNWFNCLNVYWSDAVQCIQALGWVKHSHFISKDTLFSSLHFAYRAEQVHDVCVYSICMPLYFLFFACYSHFTTHHLRCNSNLFISIRRIITPERRMMCEPVKCRVRALQCPNFGLQCIKRSAHISQLGCVERHSRTPNNVESTM